MFEVDRPVQAEKTLFELLKDYKIQGELYKADYELTIGPALEKIKAKFVCNNEIQISDEEKEKYIMKIVKKINNFKKFTDRIQQYLRQNMYKFNQQNQELSCNINNSLSMFLGQTKNQNESSGMIAFYNNSMIDNMKIYIGQFDFNDIEVIHFVNFFVKLY